MTLTHWQRTIILDCSHRLFRLLGSRSMLRSVAILLSVAPAVCWLLSGASALAQLASPIRLAPGAQHDLVFVTADVHYAADPDAIVYCAFARNEAAILSYSLLPERSWNPWSVDGSGYLDYGTLTGAVGPLVNLVEFNAGSATRSIFVGARDFDRVKGRSLNAADMRVSLPRAELPWFDSK